MSSMRGTSVIGTLQYVRDVHGEAALSRVVEALPGPVRDVVAGTVVPNAWYDVRAVAELTRTVDRVCGRGDLALARAVGRHVAFQDMSRFFKWMFRLTGPGLLFSRAGSVWNNYYQDGTYVFEGIANHHAALRIESWAGSDAAICKRIEGWIERAFELTLGAGTRPRIQEQAHEHLDPSVSPNRFCRFTADWRDQPDPR
jgi:hypothetical protein